MKSATEIQAIISNIKVGTFPTWSIYFHAAGVDDLLTDCWLQIVAKEAVDHVTGDRVSWRGRKWRLSLHMTETEIVNTALLAYQNAMQHELLESFTYRGRRIYDPHRSVDAMIAAADAGQLDVRHPGHGVTPKP